MMRFACNAPVEVKLPDEVTIGNQLHETIEYDDATKKSGRVGFRRGNWNTGNDIIYVTTLKSGTASVELICNFIDLKQFVSEITLLLGLKPWDIGKRLTGYVREFIMMSFIKDTRETGCRAYYPEGINENDATRGKGCWRLATIRENWAINSAEAWCIEDHDTNDRKAYVSYGSGNLIDNYKRINNIAITVPLMSVPLNFQIL
jgi:hypothetical protein